MRALLRAVLLVLLLLVVAIVTFGWWTGARMPNAARPSADAPTATTGTIDTSKARERGAEVGEKAAQAAATIQETVAEAAITSKIKAKMALDDSVRARTIDVSTTGSTVTLRGTVRSKEEHDRAVSLARETAGVSRVVDRLDVRH
jgi:hyperosmotically inducible periplasmic protein